ncbi:Protein CBG00753 [Caenorhabditis briggsae]|uniref:Protein CBG00753 n=1 Tax=Caenorhabditis briggsae TaxID=6238 RepID=A8WNR3_CAEBR|nr:Protein CBG00753 [Caenorhabditis briggsae]CAP22119.2 Protein CBG00753 [Caenorhabditis briggsae]
MSCFLYFSILLIPLVLGDDEVVCVPTEGENREECVMIYNGVKDNILTLNLTELENIEKFRNNCLDFEKCTAQLKCGAEKALVDTIDDIPFVKLPCFELDSGDEEALRTACSEFFGKDGCLEKEMSEGCGVDVWNGFKKNQLAMNKITGTCKFD